MHSLVIIPTLNEKENIERLVQEIMALNLDLDILIIDDNSSDGTGIIADGLSQRHKNKVYVIRREERLGIGTAYVQGFKFALGHDYEYVFEMDADFSHSPGYIPVFMDGMKRYDIIIGSRFVDNQASMTNSPLIRIVISKIGTGFSNFILGLRLSDGTSGFKCIRRKVLENIALDKIRSKGYFFQIEVNYLAQRAGFLIGEIPIIFQRRKYGSSKMSWQIIAEALWLIWRLRFMRDSSLGGA